MLYYKTEPTPFPCQDLEVQHPLHYCKFYTLGIGLINSGFFGLQ